MDGQPKDNAPSIALTRVRHKALAVLENSQLRGSGKASSTTHTQ